MAKKLHHKPTQKELDAEIKKAEESLNELDQEKPEEKPEEKSIETPEEKPTETEEESVEEKPQNYKKRYADSTREAQILHAKNKKIVEVIEKAKEISDPTEEELIAEYPDWEMMTDTERKMAKDSVISRRRFEALDEATQDFRKSEKWNAKVDKFMTDPQTLIDYPGLEGKEEEFKIFTGKETRRGVDFPDLVSAFLFEADKIMPKHKGSMFETGTSGTSEKPKPKSDKITTKESQRLRIADYKKYLEYLKAGKISDEDIT